MNHLVLDYEVAVRLFMAALWGGIVGAEREYRSKSAGFRTMILISTGACFFTYMSVLIGAPGNPDRIASNILTGIGFIGAGVIFKDRTRVSGITTAATIWAVAAVGMGIGAGYYAASAYACVLMLFVLAILPYLEALIDRMNQTKTYSICYPEGGDHHKVENLFKQFKLRYKMTEQKRKDGLLTVVWQVHGTSEQHQRFSEAVLDDTTIDSFHIYS